MSKKKFIEQFAKKRLEILRLTGDFILASSAVASAQKALDAATRHREEIANQLEESLFVWCTGRDAKTSRTDDTD